MLANNKLITRVQQVQTAVLEESGHAVAPAFVRRVMRKDMRMGYRMAKTVIIQANSERCLVQRQQYALRMLPLLESGRRLINFDESWLN